MKSNLEKKKSLLFVILSGIVITNALLGEMIGSKIFSLEKTLNVAPAQISLFGDWVLNFDLSAGVMIWPVVFLTTDIINEYFGKEGVKKISLLAVAMIIYMFFMLWIVAKLIPADFWMGLHAPLDINLALEKIFLQSMGIIVGSVLAFLLGQLIDVVVFQKLRKITGNKKIWLRATGSTLVSQLIDSFVVLFVAFYFLGQPRWTLEQLFSVGTINYSYKFLTAIAATPLIYLAHFLIDMYLGKENAQQMIKEASESKIR